MEATASPHEVQPVGSPDVFSSENSQTLESPQPAAAAQETNESKSVDSQAEPALSKRRRGGAARRGLDPGALLLGAAGCLIAAGWRAFRKQQQQLSQACQQLKSAEERLAAKEKALEREVEERKQLQEQRAQELSQQVQDAQRELEAARDVCRAAANKLEQSMSDLSVTETELRAARTQLQSAGRDLALTRAQLEATEGELGLSRSANELMKREVDTLRRQLREAGQQLEGYILVSRSRKNGDLGMGLRGGGGGGLRDDVDGDDLAVPSDGAWDF
ncbi:hypothetical protein HYH02_010981 [Chlamydomonas schloesseri]|uniref:Uncharacterized protein n=1 Tax=Chlamydomonas schloesseri TaxID=2026947 RepID=A0A835W5P3_9CHLO|nr:hypothetical protein HYH02_010981 [Chlamydomonas schloesseri]|eukprot:KAG2438283.1 hypothetical protein HYH02_010981 [Chlamydomonas schloesseri]